MQTITDHHPTPLDRVAALKREMKQAIQDIRLDEAKAAFAELTERFGVDPESDDMLASRVTLGVFDGRKLDMLQLLNGLDEDRAPGLRAICLQLVGDPLWEVLALQVERSTADPNIRRAMRSLRAASDDESEDHANSQPRFF